MSEHGRVLKAAVTKVRKALKEAGFESTQSSFWRQTGVAGYRVEEANVECVEVQTARSGGECVINYGVISAYLWRTQSGEPPTGKREATQWHWRHRVSGEDGREQWIPIGDDAQEMAADLLVRIEGKALPDIQRHLSDESLLETWLSGESGGLTEPRRLLFAAVLLKKLDRNDRLRDVVRELRELVAGQPFAPRILSELQRLGLDES